MSFPHRARFFGLPLCRDGWQDRGRLEPTYLKDGEIVGTLVHAYCHTRLRIGIENGLPFRYCPRCLLKVTQAAGGQAAGERERAA